MKRTIAMLLLVFSTCILASAQKTAVEERVNLVVGGSLKIKACPKGKSEFTGIDIYARNAAYDKSKVKKATGEGLMEAFFEKNTSIDAKRLPCSMGGRSYKIASLQEFDTPDGTKRVVICYTAFELTLIWIDLDKALEAGEIEL
ncbi:MAG: hypothetical protein L6Q78_10260 [Bacteroidia bacterium]|nr:hypothetical protein [Bacteroidia bacterium]